MRPLRFLLAVLAITLWQGMAVAAEPVYWQLVIQYSAEGMEVVEAGEMPPLQKQVRTPGLDGAPLTVGCEVSFLDAGGKLMALSVAELPLGIRAAYSSTEGCEPLFPKEGVIVVRLEGPAGGSEPASLRLRRSSVSERRARLADAPSVLQFTDATLSIRSVTHPGKQVAGPVGSAKIRDTGPDSNRLVIVVMGDGYTSANLTAGDFTADANDLVAAFLGKAPWTTYFAATNVYRVDIESNEEGADEPPPGPGIYKDTYLNCSYWLSGIERLLFVTGTGYSRAVSAANAQVGTGVWDAIFVLVNHTKYGGGGGAIGVSSIHPSAAEITLHEFGHSFSALADEYDYGGTGPPGSANEPNVDFDSSGPALKWIGWVQGGTPLPTPETPPYDNVVGAFEGAKYWTTGIYRPWNDCLMRNLNRPFCPVCNEATVKKFRTLVALADSVTPANASTVSVDSTGTTFLVSPLPITLAYEWRLNGNLIPAATTNQLHLDSGEIPPLPSTLSVIVSHPTSLVLQPLATNTYQWNLEPDVAAVRDLMWLEME